MGPYSEKKQQERRDTIQNLLDNNPDLDPVTRDMWQRHLHNIAIDEGEYVKRVREVYGNIYSRYTDQWLT